MATFKCISEKDFSKKANSAYKTALLTLSLKPDENISIPNKVISALQKLVDKEYSDKDKLTVQQKKDIVDAAYDGMISAGLPENVIANPSELYAAFFPGGTMYNENIYDLVGGDFDNGIFDNSTPSEKLASELITMYGSHQLACSMMKNRFDNLIVPSIFINRGHVVHPNSISINLFMTKLDLLNGLLNKMIDEANGIKQLKDSDTISELKAMKSNVESAIRSINNMESVQQKEVAARGLTINIDPEEVFRYFNIIYPGLESKLNEYTQKKSKGDIDKLNAYNDMFILRNMDALLDSVFGGTIKPSNPSAMISFKDYDATPIYNTIKSWHDEDKDINAFEQAGSITRAIINTIKYFDFKTKTIVEGGRLGWSRFNSAIGILKQIPKSKLRHLKSEDGRTLGELIADAASNPDKGWKDVFDFLFSYKVNNEFESMTYIEYIANELYRNSSSIRQTFVNSAYSIYREFFQRGSMEPAGEDPTMDLYKSMDDFTYVSRDLPNYFGFITHYMNGINRIPFTAYSIKWDNGQMVVKPEKMDEKSLRANRTAFDAKIYNTIRNMMTDVEMEINDMISRNRKVLGIKDDAEIPQFKVSNNFEELKEGANGGEIILENFPIIPGDGWTQTEIKNGKFKPGPGLYTIKFVTNQSIVGEGSSLFIKIDGEFKEMNDAMIQKIARLISGTNYSSSIDSLLDILMQTDISGNSELRKLMLNNPGSGKGGIRIARFLRAALYMTSIAHLNRDYVPTHIKNNDSLESFLKNYFRNTSQSSQSEAKPNFVSLRYRLGINPISIMFNETMDAISNAVSALENSIFRDTVRSDGGKTVGITQQLRMATADYLQMTDISRNVSAAAKKSWMQLDVRGFAKEAFGMSDLEIENMAKELKINIDDDIFGLTTVDREAGSRDKSKTRSQFNINESFAVDFSINYLDGMFAEDEEINGYTSMFAEVNSDKSMITKPSISNSFLRLLRAVRENYDKRRPEEGEPLNDAQRKYYGIWKQVELMAKSAGSIYEKIVQNIDSTYNLLSSYANTMANEWEQEKVEIDNDERFSDRDKNILAVIAGYINGQKRSTSKVNADGSVTIQPPAFELDYYNNFRNFNDIVKRISNSGVKISAYEIPFVLAKMANVLYNKGKQIKIIDQTHLIKGKNNTIQFNSILVNDFYKYNKEHGRYGRTLIEGTKKFDLAAFIPKGYDMNARNHTYFSTLDQTFSDKINEMAYYMLKSGISVDFNAQGESTMRFRGLEKLKNLLEEKAGTKEEGGRAIQNKSPWISNNRLVLMRVKMKSKGGEYYRDITSLDDLKRYRFVTSENMTTLKGFMDSLTKERKIGGSDILDVEVNPYLLEFNFIDFFTSENYRLSTIGGVFNHKTNAGVELYADEAAAIASGNANKRNVSFTATYQPFQFNTLNGVPETMNVACVEDVEADVSSYSGNDQVINPHDGICHMSPTYVYWLLNSTEDSKVGFDMKPFIHGYDEETASGIIIKSSTNALTNEACRKGKNARILMRKTMGAKWRLLDGSLVNGDIFKDYYRRGNEPVDLAKYLIEKYNPIIELKRGEFYRIESIQRNGNIIKRTLVQVNQFGEDIESGEVRSDDFNVPQSNYDLWQLFGAEQAREYDKNLGKIIPSENSIKMVADMANFVGQVYDENITHPRSQKDIYQFMKHGNADLIVSNGAIKQGYSNINRFEDVYYNESGLPNTFKIGLKYGGIQLDPTHTAANSETSELTQVMSALSSMGFTKYDTNNIYNALGMVAESTVNRLLAGSIPEGEIKPDSRKFAANIIIAAMAESNSLSDEERIRAKKLIERYKNGEILEYNDVANVLKLNSMNFLQRVTPAITAYVNNISIKKKFPGTLGLIKASYGLVQLYDNKTYEELGVDDAERWDSVTEIQARYDANPLMVGQTRMGHIYKVTFNEPKENEIGIESIRSDERYSKYAMTSRLDKNGKMVYELFIPLRTYDDYTNLKNFKLDHSEAVITEAIVRKKIDNEKSDFESIGLDGIILGRELAPIDYKFTIGEGEAMEYYNFYDLDAVKWMFEVKKTIKAINKLEGDLKKDPKNETIKFQLGSLRSSLEIIKNNILKILGENSSLHINVDKNWDISTLVRVFHQKQLSELDKAYRGIPAQVTINGEIREINTGSLEVFGYESIIPNVNAEKFGLDQYTKLSEVSPEAFARNELLRGSIPMKSGNFSYALEMSNGKFLYVFDSGLSNTDFDYSGFERVELKKGSNRLKKVGKNRYLFLDEHGNPLFEYENAQDIYYNKSIGSYAVIIPPLSPTILRSAEYDRIVFSPGIFKDTFGKNRENESATQRGLRESIKKIADGGVYRKTKDGVILASNSTARIVDNDYDELIEAYLDAWEIASMNDESNQIVVNMTSSKTRQALDLLDKEGIQALENNKNSKYIRNIARRANAKYQAFRESLNTLTARIPSQTMQSFMSMIATAFGNTGVNAVYVSDMQVWLQGSDFDGDKATFQMYSFDRGGNFIGWSPYFDKYNLKESMRLPFPNGAEITEVRNNEPKKEDLGAFKNQMADYIEYKTVADRLFGLSKEGKLEMKPEATMKDKARFIELLNNFRRDLGVTWLPMFSTGDKNLANIIRDNSAYEKVLEWVNDHNTFYKDVNDRKVNGLKNFITYTSMRISENPINLYESQSSIDDFSLIKEEGAKDEGNKERISKNYMNVFTKWAAFYDNMMGKQVVSATAASIKNFFMLTQYLNTASIEGDVDEILKVNDDCEEALKALDKVLLGKGGTIEKDKAGNETYNHNKGININGKTYLTIANWNPDNKTRALINGMMRKINSKMYDEEGHRTNYIPTQNEKIIITLDSTLRNSLSKQDAALILSALLTEATDNAKNLTLSKINATPELLSLYVYGITIGMDFSEIASYIRSNTANIFCDLKLGNIFYGTGRSNMTFSRMNDEIIKEKKFVGSKGYVPNNGGFSQIRRTDSMIATFFNLDVSDSIVEITKNGEKEEAKLKNENVFIKVKGRVNDESTEHSVDLYFSPKTIYDKFIQGGLPSFIYLNDNDPNVSENVLIINANKEVRNLSGKLIKNENAKNKIFINSADAIEAIRWYLKRKNYPQRQDIDNWANNAQKIVQIRKDVNSEFAPDNGTEVIGNRERMIDVLMKLEEGAREMTRLGAIAGLNKGVKGNFNEQSSSIQSMQTLLSGLSPNTSKMFADAGYTTANIYKQEFKDEEGNIIQREDITLDIDLFDTDPEYASIAEEAYNRDKRVSFNILGVAKTVPHLNKYFHVFNAITGMTENMSAISKSSRWLTEALLKRFRNATQKERSEISKNSAKFVNYMLMDRFLNDKNRRDKGLEFKFYVPDKFKYYKLTSSGEIKETTAQGNTLIRLGDKASKMTFLKWMYDVVVPNLKNGYFDESDRSRRDIFPNEFIKSLVGVYNNKTLTSVGVDVYSLSLNPSSNNEYDMQLKEKLKQESARLKYAHYYNKTDTSEVLDLNPLDLLWLTDQFIFNGMNARYSLNEYVSVIPSTMENEFMKYVDNFFTDKNTGKFNAALIESIIPKNDLILEQIAQCCAPIGNTYYSDCTYVKSESKMYKTVNIYMKKDTDIIAIRKDDGGEEGYSDDPIDEGGFDQYADLDEGENTDGPKGDFNKDRYDLIHVSRMPFDNFPEFSQDIKILGSENIVEEIRNETRKIIESNGGAFDESQEIGNKELINMAANLNARNIDELCNKIASTYQPSDKNLNFLGNISGTDYLAVNTGTNIGIIKRTTQSKQIQNVTAISNDSSGHITAEIDSKIASYNIRLNRGLGSLIDNAIKKKKNNC